MAGTYIQRPSTGTTIKEIMDWQPSGTRQTWLNQLLADVMKLGVHDWQKASRSKQEWSILAERMRKKADT